MPKASRGAALPLIETTLDDMMATIREQNIIAMRRDNVSEADIAALDGMNEREFQAWKRATLVTLCFELFGKTLSDGPKKLQ